MRIGEITIEVLVWNGTKHVKEYEESGFFPAITLGFLDARGWEVTDVNAYPALNKVIVFARPRKEN